MSGGGVSTGYVRTDKPGATSRAEPFEPLAPGHPTIGDVCLACGETFAVGDRLCLVALGPGRDEDAREACARGGFYSAVAARLHWACATGREP